jgi:hypothetical protein
MEQITLCTFESAAAVPLVCCYNTPRIWCTSWKPCTVHGYWSSCVWIATLYTPHKSENNNNNNIQLLHNLWTSSFWVGCTPMIGRLWSLLFRQVGQSQLFSALLDSERLQEGWGVPRPLSLSLCTATNGPRHIPQAICFKRNYHSICLRKEIYYPSNETQ